MSAEVFGLMPDGTPVRRYGLRSGGLTAHFLTYGAVLQDLRLEGHSGPLVLGFEAFDHYLAHSRYFGATAGRYANRIRDGHLELDGRTFQLDTNSLGKHTLHGGGAGIGKRVWELKDLAADSITLGIRAADGEMGFPGNLDILQTFRLLEGGVLDITMRATTDATTLCNLAHHSYFNLGAESTVDGHTLRVDAETYLPVDTELIPTGEPAPVAGTRFDFRRPAALGSASAQGLIDHNFCLSDDRVAIRTVAELCCPETGVAMGVRTTEPGLQVYCGAALDVPVPGLDGRRMGPRSGIALEPQVWPDAPHHPAFPQAVLRPGETYRQNTQFLFRKESR